jgi:hypothetical protein
MLNKLTRSKKPRFGGVFYREYFVMSGLTLPEWQYDIVFPDGHNQQNNPRRGAEQNGDGLTKPKSNRATRRTLACYLHLNRSWFKIGRFGSDRI